MRGCDWSTVNNFKMYNYYTIRLYECFLYAITKIYDLFVTNFYQDKIVIKVNFGNGRVWSYDDAYLWHIFCVSSLV